MLPHALGFSQGFGVKECWFIIAAFSFCAQYDCISAPSRAKLLPVALLVARSRFFLAISRSSSANFIVKKSLWNSSVVAHGKTRNVGRLIIWGLIAMRVI